ncbi:hypothetical protein V8E55_008200 [Tylopilus felleus]
MYCTFLHIYIALSSLMLTSAGPFPRDKMDLHGTQPVLPSPVYNLEPSQMAIVPSYQSIYLIVVIQQPFMFRNRKACEGKWLTFRSSVGGQLATAYGHSPGFEYSR